jgi:hypothetical protein
MVPSAARFPGAELPYRVESQEPGTPTPALEKEEKKRELPFCCID